MEWTRDKTLALINEYRKRRGLWDMTHEDYRKKEIKHKLLVEVAGMLGNNISVVEVEKKFHTLRTQYHREISRMNRKEPYNSKWFGFKNLQFLSSPKACRMGKGRIKSEINEDGTVTKYIIRESPVLPASSQEASALGGSNSNLNEEFVSIPPKQPKYERSPGSSASRSRELEKLIEETTKDVDEVEEPKMKISKRTNSAPLEHHTYSATVSSNGEMTVNEHHSMDHHQQEEENHIESQHNLGDEQQIETIDIQTGEDINYQATSSPSGDTQHGLHHQAVPARIIKIQRRETCPDDEYYDDDDQQGQNSSGTKHRIYYETNGQQHTATILAPSPCTATSSANSTVVTNSSPKVVQNTSLVAPQPRDDFITYGEYVANEMRGITNREILIALKHKINTALFEANMAELRK